MSAPPYSSSTVMPSRPSAPELRPEVARKLVVAVDRRRARRDGARGECRDRVAQDVEGFAQLEVESLVHEVGRRVNG